MYLILFLILILLSSILPYRKGIETFGANICPDKLTKNKNLYLLWNSNNVIKKYNSYFDYMKEFNYNQFNYYNKNFECSPLIPYKNDKLTNFSPGSILDISSINSRLFNLY